VERNSSLFKTKGTTGLRGVCLDSIEFTYSDYETGTYTKKIRLFSTFIKAELDSLIYGKTYKKKIIF